MRANVSRLGAVLNGFRRGLAASGMKSEELATAAGRALRAASLDLDSRSWSSSVGRTVLLIAWDPRSAFVNDGTGRDCGGAEMQALASPSRVNPDKLI